MFHQPVTLDFGNLGMLGAMGGRIDWAPGILHSATSQRW
jgi:hypothetical protein